MNQQPITVLKGIGEKTAGLFAKLGVETVEELLHDYPRAYDAYEEPVPVGKLREKGMKSTQATISRDIKELHLVKELTGRSTYKYAVSERKTSLNVAGRLNNIFRESVTSFDSAQNIVVLKTMPGLASAACSALDGMHLPNMVGSLAGDDTAILIMRTTQDAEELCLEIVKMLEKNP